MEKYLSLFKEQGRALQDLMKDKNNIIKSADRGSVIVT